MRLRPKRARLPAVAAATVIVAGCGSGAPHSGAKRPAVKGPGGPAVKGASYYLALGDSLSVGVQPTAGGLQPETKQGYANFVYQHYRQRDPGLQLVQFGCPGESTVSILGGPKNQSVAAYYHCRRRGGDQLTAAVAFLHAHHKPGEVPLVTIDLGANDIDGCFANPAKTGTGGAYQCLAAGEAAIKRNLPRILKTLRAAAPAGTRFVGITLYDPYVATTLLPANNPLRAAAQPSLQLVRSVNADIAAADQQGGFRTADLSPEFKTFDTTAVAFGGYNAKTAPADVAQICRYTWICTPPPRGPNIHAKTAGYKAIATAVEAAAGSL